MNKELRTLIFGFISVSLTLAVVFVLVYKGNTGNALSDLARRTPLLLTGSTGFDAYDGGFAANIIISICAMIVSLVTGAVLGAGLIARSAAVRALCDLVMNVLRNSPWLVVLYAMLYLLPFEVEVGNISVTVSPLVKAIVGLALPVTANIAETFRSGVEAIPSGQWESARALGYRHLQILHHVVVPQALPIMMPNLMTVFAMLFIGSSLVVVTGTNDVLTVARTAIGSDGAELATAFYIYVLFMFFMFAFPIAIASRWLERRVRERQR